MLPILALLFVVAIVALTSINALDLVFMGSSADRSAADVALPICAGERLVKGSGNPGTGTSWYPKAAGAIKGAFVNSETAAMVELWLKATEAKNRMKLWATHLQTDPLRTQIITPMNYPISVGDAIEAAGENAGAVLDLLGIYVDVGKGGEVPTPWPTKPLPSNSLAVRLTGTQTLVADTVTEGDLSAEDFTFKRDVRYNIEALGLHGASMLAGRLRFEDIMERPGVPAADTSTGLEYKMWYGDFGSFLGQNIPTLEAVAVAGDTAQVVNMIVTPGARGRQVA